MTDFPRDKKKITQLIIDELSKTVEVDEFGNLMVRWWMNVRKNGGLRLTDDGDIAFRSAGLECWDYVVSKDEINQIISMSGVLHLDRNMPCPYYIRYDKKEKVLKIRIYDSRVAMMVQLQDSLIDYLDSLSKHHK